MYCIPSNHLIATSIINKLPIVISYKNHLGEKITTSSYIAPGVTDVWIEPNLVNCFVIDFCMYPGPIPNCAVSRL